ncbi:MAG: Pseudouridine synthase [Candidatus Peregrinibacteria bacterium GW2011_GWA2_47_7]|nr:MAG: Pseudouridine synthase [Candidatus Peregrinibacteria bacterium GW2011_GWA2_47_7]
MERLDLHLTESVRDFSRSVYQKFIKNVGVTVNDKLVKKAHTPLKKSDVVKVDKKALKAFVKSLAGAQTRAEVVKDIPILYKTKSFLVFDKPPFMRTETLIQGLLPVHRLDKDTSGILVAAKNIKTQAALQKQWKAREVQKTYLALVRGEVSPLKGRIEAGIARSLNDRRKMAVSKSVKARAAVTEYEVLEKFDCKTINFPLCLVRAFPKTGRTHQIRVHFASIGHPIAGDAVYGDTRLNEKLYKVAGLNRQFLHAEKLTLTNPTTKKELVLTSKLPKDLTMVRKILIELL